MGPQSKGGRGAGRDVLGVMCPPNMVSLKALRKKGGSGERCSLFGTYSLKNRFNSNDVRKEKFKASRVLRRPATTSLMPLMMS